MCHFQAQNSSFAMNNFFLVQTIIITFIYLLALFTVQNSHLTISPFHCAKFKKNSSSESRVMRVRNFWAQKSDINRY